MLSDTWSGCVKVQSVCGVGCVCVGSLSIPLDEGAGRGKVQRWVVPSFGIPGKEVVDSAVILGVPQVPWFLFFCVFPFSHFATPHLAIFYSPNALPTFVLSFLSGFGTKRNTSRFLPYKY